MKQQLALDLADPPRRERAAALRSAHFRSHVPADEALARETAAGRQERRILAVFQHRPGACLTPSQVRGLLCDECGPQAPLLTSVRRALTNLTTRGKLVHHETDRRPGPHGAKESTWSLS